MLIFECLNLSSFENEAGTFLEPIPANKRHFKPSSSHFALREMFAL